MRRSLPHDILFREAGEDMSDAAEAKAAFHLRMRARGIRDTNVLRAFELVPRQAFVPHSHLDLAARDLALPIGCGQTMDAPWLVGRTIEALSPQPASRVLQVGAGTGYATAILAQLAAEVMALERYKSLAQAAQSRLAALAIANAAVVWGDGLAVPESVAGFDRILVHGLLPELPASLTDRLAADAILVAARPHEAGQMVTQITRGADTWVETAICPCRMLPVASGLPSIL